MDGFVFFFFVLFYQPNVFYVTLIHNKRNSNAVYIACSHNINIISNQSYCFKFTAIFKQVTLITFLNDEYKLVCNDIENYKEINTYLGGAILQLIKYCKITKLLKYPK